MEAICVLCLKTAKQVRFKLLVKVSSQEITSWTYNILTLDECGKLCMKCCQSLSHVGELLFQWRDKIRVSLESARENLQRVDQSPLPSLICKNVLEKDNLLKNDEEIDEILELDNCFEADETDDLCGDNESMWTHKQTKASKVKETPCKSTLCSTCGVSGADCGCKKLSVKPTSKESLADCPKLKRDHDQRVQNGYGGRSGWKSYSCQFCSKRFATSERCEKHKRLEHNSDPQPKIVCSISGCGESFRYKKDEKVHMKTAHNLPVANKIFLCKFCPKTFERMGNLEEHERIHTNEKPYQCKHCSMSFRMKNFLTKHVTVHTGEKKYKCSYCDRRFRMYSNRDTHQRHVHKTKQFACPNNCGKVFIRQKHATSHFSACLNS